MFCNNHTRRINYSTTVTGIVKLTFPVQIEADRQKISILPMY